jgi:hypothetical protein
MNAHDFFTPVSLVLILSLSAEYGNTQCLEGDCETGQGTYRYSNGDLYEGQWRNNKPDGQGNYRFSRPRQQYDGQFEQGRIHGIGTMKFADGSWYQGSWENGKMNGAGTLTNAFGKQKSGTWKAGQFLEAPVYQVYQAKPTTPVKATPINYNPTKIYAVIVGISQYWNRTLPFIQYADDDADSVRVHLRNLMDESSYQRQVVMLKQDDATKDEILQALRRQFLKADENDVILFYFSGHGLRGAFLPADYNGTLQKQVTHEDLQRIFKQSRAKHKICIADACFSGALSSKGSFSTSQLQPFYIAFENAQGGTALLLSSRPEQESFEDPQLRHGVFTFYLLHGLGGEADANGDSIVNIKELYEFVLPRVWNYTQGAQSPMLTGDYDASIPLGVVLR